MIRANFKHSRKGVVFQRDEEITNLTHDEEQQAVETGLAYYDKPKKTVKPTMENTKKEIEQYLDENGIEYDEFVTKSELLELC